MEKQKTFVKETPPFLLATQEEATDLYVDTVESSKNYFGIAHAADNLAGDIEAVTGMRPMRKGNIADISGQAVIIGSIGNSPVIDSLIASGKLDVSEIKGKWEAYIHAVIEKPVNGIIRALVIAGSDKRGTIFGIYKISEKIGVSPYGFFADSRPMHRDNLVLSGETIIQGEPSVKYRGIFINDEDSTQKWMQQFNPVPLKNPIASIGLNHTYYAHVFDLILRNYGNYLWPAMWNNAFWTDDPENPRMADAYGVIMGTSHQEFMASSDKEWVWSGRGKWDYQANKEQMYDFWETNVRERMHMENIYTVGLRGLNDTAIMPNGTQAENTALLQEVIDDQYQMLRKALEKLGDTRDVTEIPKMTTLYKEVERFYYSGMSLPSDITLMLCEDNQGHMRTLPTPEMRKERYHDGGFGMYYHFDYNGAPRSYRWVNTMPLEKTREQMMMAYEYGVDRIWIVNVGDLKFNELPIDYWFKLAYDIETWGRLDGPEKAYRDFAAKQFGEEWADEIAGILFGSTQINNIRKPEVVLHHNFSLTYFNEAENLLARYKELAKKAEDVFGRIPKAQRDAYYGLVLYPVRISANAWNLMINLQKSKLYGQLGLTAANDYAQIARNCLQFDGDEMYYTWGAPELKGKDMDYYCVADGKYYGYFPERSKRPPYHVVKDSGIYYLGLTTWNHRTQQLELTDEFTPGAVEAPDGSDMVVLPQTWISPHICHARSDEVSLPPFFEFDMNDRSDGEARYIDIANAGLTPFTYTAKASAPWMILNKTSATVDKIDRLKVRINWESLLSEVSVDEVTSSDHGDKIGIGSGNPIPMTIKSGSVTITGAGSQVRVNVTVKVADSDFIAKLPKKTYIETDGYVSILSKNFSASVPDNNGAKWTILPNYGREISSIKVMPSVTDAGYGGERIPEVNSAYVEYLVYINTPGAINIVTQWAPTNPLDYRQIDKLTYGVSFGGDVPQIVDAIPSGFGISDREGYWATGVMTAVRTLTMEADRICVSEHRASKPGLYTLRIYMVNDGLVLQKILVGTEATERTSIGGKQVTDIFIGPQKAGEGSSVFEPVRTSFLGPPETYYKS